MELLEVSLFWGHIPCLGRCMSAAARQGSPGQHSNASLATYTRSRKWLTTDQTPCAFPSDVAEVSGTTIGTSLAALESRVRCTHGGRVNSSWRIRPGCRNRIILCAEQAARFRVLVSFFSVV